MHDLAELLRAVSWPAVVLIVLFALRSELTAMAAAIAGKIERANKIKITKSGFELAEEVARRTIAPAETARTVVAGAARGETEEQEFNRLAEAYLHLEIADAATRIAERRRLADRLGQLALSLGLPRQALAESGHEGKLVALATAVVLEPKARDLLALERAAQSADFNFTRYRIVLALLPSLSRRTPGRDALRRVATVLSETENRAGATTEPSLQRLIDKVRQAVADLGSG